MEIQTITKFAVKSATFERLEGYEDECVKVEFNTIEELEDHVASILHTAAKDYGYDKAKYFIEWEDGQTYEGRMDLQHPFNPSFKADNYKVENCIKSFLHYMMTEGHFTPEETNEAAQFLATREY